MSEEPKKGANVINNAEGAMFNFPFYEKNDLK